MVRYDLKLTIQSNLANNLSEQKGIVKEVLATIA